MGPIRRVLALAVLMGSTPSFGAVAASSDQGLPAPAPVEDAVPPAVPPAEAPPDPRLRAPQPLALRGSRADDVIHALMVISQGDAEAIAGLTPDLFHADVAVADDEDGDLGRRWSLLVPRAIARLDPSRRAPAIAALDALCRKDLAAVADAGERAVLAEDFIPAPSAVAALSSASGRAFDHGRFSEALLFAQLLGADAVPADDAAAARRAAALKLGARGPEIEAEAQLVAPGMPRQVGGAAAEPEDQGLAVGWSAQRGWLLALDAARRVLWQYRVELDAEVVTGAGAALVRDSAGLRAIDELGRVSTLTPPPGDTRCLAVAGGAAWFATGGRAWRLPLVATGASGAAPRSLDLGSDPLCPPLVRGARSLWLTRDELLLFDEATPLHRIRHFLDARPGWRLSADRGPGEGASGVSISARDGTTWRLEPFARQLADADPVARARLLTQASRFGDALDVLSRSPLDAATPDGRQVAFAAHAGLGPEHVALHADEIAALAASPDDQAAVWWARFRREEPTAPDLARGHAQALVGFLHAHPDGLIAWSPADLGAPRDAWSHAVDGATLGLALERWLAGPVATKTAGARAAPIALVMDAGLPMPSGVAVDDSLVLDPQLGQAHLHAGALIQLDHGQGFTRVTSRDATTRRLRWRNRWAADPTVHSRAMAISDGCVLVAEGPSRLVVIDAATGERRMVAVSNGIALLPSQTRVLSRTRLAMLDQSARGDGLVLVEAVAAGTRAFEPLADAAVATHATLPGPARWMVPVPGREAALVLLADGRALLCVDSRIPPLEARLPAGLRGERAPTATAEGLSADGRLYPWDDAPRD